METLSVSELSQSKRQYGDRAMGERATSMGSVGRLAHAPGDIIMHVCRRARKSAGGLACPPADLCVHLQPVGMHVPLARLCVRRQACTSAGGLGLICAGVEF